MATRLDRQIEQLENIVEKHLDLCQATWNETRCTLPRNHEPTAPHKFRIEISEDDRLQRSNRAIAERTPQREPERVANRGLRSSQFFPWE